MSEKKYEVLDNFGHILARDMDITTALLLMKAYCEKYFREQVELVLREMDRCEAKESEEE